ncbi:MAG: hypothetical protein WC565_09390 [Parcubacteria group bacterium]|jgi:hypothetical protein
MTRSIRRAMPWPRGNRKHHLVAASWRRGRAEWEARRYRRAQNAAIARMVNVALAVCRGEIDVGQVLVEALQ